MKGWVAGLAAWILIGGFYLLTAPVNRSEAEDAYAYAWQVEQPSWQATVHPHHLLYGPAMKALLSAARALGYRGRSHPLMCGVGAFSAALALLLLFLLLRRSGIRTALAAASAAGLGVSYGFWRYAAEAEIYAPAAALAVATLCMASVRAGSVGRGVAGGTVGALAAGMHVLCAIPALVAAPVLLAWRREFARATAHLLTAGLLWGAGSWAFSPSRPAAASADMGATERRHGHMLIKGAAGAGQALCSGNFLFAYEAVRGRMRALFPYRMLDEEFFMGRRTPTALRVLAPLTGAAAVGGMAFCGIICLGRLRRERTGAAAGPTFPPPDASAAVCATAWLGTGAAVVLWFEPGNPEMWLLNLPPLWWLGGWVFQRVAASRPAILGVTAGLLALHNLIGGLLPLRDAEGDYLLAKAGPVLAQAGSADRVLVAGGPVFFRYVRYHTAAEAIDLYAVPLPRLTGLMDMPSSGRTWMFDDAAEPPAALTARFPDRARQVREFAHRARPLFTPWRTNECGIVYVHDARASR